MPARGNFSLRKIARSFLAVILSALFLTIMSSTVTHAADANWQDDGSIVYDGKTYRAVSPIPTGVNVPQGSTVFVAKDDASPTASVLYIEPNADTTKEMKVKVAEYTVANTGEYTNPRPPTPTEVSLAAKPGAKDKTQCDVAGVGWIICVTSRFIAGGMDNIFGIIASYLEVKPVSTNTESGLYRAWSVALGIANLMFILAFLMIIYAQLTSYGMSNYDIKKMIPKLIVSAILVNISYYICSIAVDVSNILGHSVQQALIDVRTSLPDPAPGSLDSGSWKNITEYILSGGTIIAGGMAGYAALAGGAAGGSISGLAFLLFPILVAGALAVLIALLVLAARQALITVLIVVAPLAFVAYLLPNTEKWFEKWRDLFMTMLLVFPLFSLLFGGSQLASYIIIQNADQISIVIFAMFIQVAPLVMTPFLVKFSGSLLGRLAGMVNDPKRGVVDRARNWATDKAEVQRGKGFAAAQKGGGTRLQRSAYRRELDKKNRESWKKTGEHAVDAGWAHDRRGHRHHGAHRELEDIKSSGESTSNRQYEQRRSVDANLQRYAARERVNNEAIKSLQSAETAAWEEAKSNKMQAGNRFANFSTEAKTVLREQKIADGKTKFAQSEQSDEWANMVIKNTTLQSKIGGIGGAERALAAATAEFRKNYNERVGEGEQVLKHYNMSGTERQRHAMGETVYVDDGHGSMKVFRSNSTYTREAAIDTQMRQGTVDEVEEILKESGGKLKSFSTTIAAAMAEGKLSSKAVYAGGQTINDVGQGTVVGDAGLDNAVRTTMLKGKVGPADLATNDATALKRLFRVAQEGNTTSGFTGTKANEFSGQIEAMRQAAYAALTNPSLSGQIKKNARVELNNILKQVTTSGTDPEPVTDANGATVVIDPSRDY